MVSVESIELEPTLLHFGSAVRNSGILGSSFDLNLSRETGRISSICIKHGPSFPSLHSHSLPYTKA